MGDWASHLIEKLLSGETVKFRPRGNSMRGRVPNGALCTAEPFPKLDYTVGDVVICRVKGRSYLHLIKAVKGDQYQIGNNIGGINGWITRHSIYGKLVSVEK